MADVTRALEMVDGLRRNIVECEFQLKDSDSASLLERCTRLAKLLTDIKKAT